MPQDPSIPYTVKLSSGRTFAVVHKIHYSLKNFRSASGCGHHILYTASDSRGKLLRSTEKPQKTQSFPTRKYAVYGDYLIFYMETLFQNSGYAPIFKPHIYEQKL